MAQELQVWGRATSSNVQGVMWAIGELGLDHTRYDISGSFGGNDTPEYLAMNPMGLVPTLKDGDLIIFESAAIIRYLAARYGDATFWPRDPVVRARQDMMAEWAKATFYPVITLDLFWQLIRTLPKDIDPNRIAEGEKKMVRLVPIVEAWLEHKPFLGGDALSFADIIFGQYLYRYFTMDFTRPDAPILQAYYDRLTQLPAYRTHVMVDYNVLRPT